MAHRRRHRPGRRPAPLRWLQSACPPGWIQRKTARVLPDAAQVFKLASLPGAARFLPPGVTLLELQQLARALTDVQAAAIGHAQAVTHCGDSISIDAPEQYGRIDIHSYLQAALHARQPVIHALPLVVDHQRPICLSVWPQQHATGSANVCFIEQVSRGSTELLEQRRHLGLARKGAS